MGRKKQKRKEVKPFCYYCDRDFDDEKVLIQHQKAKHYKCSECHKKLGASHGLMVHLLQVHKKNITEVPNSIAGRGDITLDIHGMIGVPADVIAEHESGDYVASDDESSAAKKPKHDPNAGPAGAAGPSGAPMPLLPMPGAMPPGPGGPPPAGFNPMAMPFNAGMMPFGRPPGPFPGQPPGPMPPNGGPPGGPAFPSPFFGGPLMPPRGPPMYPGGPSAPGGPPMFPGGPPGPYPPFGAPPAMPPGGYMGMPPPGHPGGPMGHMPPNGPPGSHFSGPPQPPQPGLTAVGPDFKPIGGAGTAVGSTDAKDGDTKVELVYKDENESMEEKRAKLDRYRMDDSRTDVSKLSESIQARLQRLQAAKLLPPTNNPH